MNEVQMLEMLCKVRAIEATLLGSPFKKEYLAYLNYFDAQIFQELQTQAENKKTVAEEPNVL